MCVSRSKHRFKAYSVVSAPHDDAGTPIVWTAPVIRRVALDERPAPPGAHPARQTPQAQFKSLASAVKGARSRWRASAISGDTHMPTTYLPRVTATAHEDLRRLVDNYPANSYEKWLSLQEKEIANWQRSGWDVVLIDVTADDFVRYCKDTGASPNFHTFRAIASAKAIGKFT
jgi:hypothetical protein